MPFGKLQLPNLNVPKVVSLSESSIIVLLDQFATHIFDDVVIFSELDVIAFAVSVPI